MVILIFGLNFLTLKGKNMRNIFRIKRIDSTLIEKSFNYLYPYQQESIENLNKHLSNGLKGQFILPTGSGKTKIMEHLIGNFIDNANVPIRFATFCHRLMLSNNLLERQIIAHVINFNMKKLTVITLHSCNMYEFATNLNDKYPINIKYYKDKEEYFGNFKHYDNDTEVKFFEFNDYNKDQIQKKIEREEQEGRDVMFAILYHSMDKLLNTDIEFDFAFYDEAHTTTSNEFFNTLKEVEKHSNINLFFTATKVTDHPDFDMNNIDVYGNDIINKLPKDMVYGKYICPISLVYMDLLNLKNDVIEYSEKHSKTYVQLNAIMSVFDSHTKRIHTDSNNKREPILFVAVTGNSILKDIKDNTNRDSKRFKSWRVNNQIDLYITSAECKGYIDYFKNDDNDLEDLSKDEFIKHLNDEVLGNRKTLIIQIDQLTEGIDLPCINGALNLRSNGKNAAKFMQFIGRSVRRDNEDRKLIKDPSINFDNKDKFIKPFAYVYMVSCTSDETEQDIQMNFLSNLYTNYGDIIFKSMYIEKANGLNYKVLDNPTLAIFNKDKDDIQNPTKIKKYHEYIIKLIEADHITVDKKKQTFLNWSKKHWKKGEPWIRNYIKDYNNINDLYQHFVEIGEV